MAALILILLSAFLHAVVNLMTKQAGDKYAVRVLIGTSSALLAMPGLVFLPLPRGLAAELLLATALVHAAYEYLLVRAYESAAFSAAYPIARGSGPLFAALGVVVVLHQPLAVPQALGIVCVCGGVVSLGWSHRTGRGAGTGVGYAVATGGTIGAYTLIDATGVRAVANPLIYVGWFFVAHAASLLLVAPIVRGRGVLKAAAQQWRKAALLGGLSVVSYGGALVAYRLGATARLAALRETSVLFGIALAVLFLQETMNARRWLAAGAIAAGAIVLAGA